MSRLDELYELSESGEPLTREDTQYLLDEALRLRSDLRTWEGLAPRDLYQRAKQVISGKEWSPEEAEKTGTHCSICGKPQLKSPGGVTCPEGHGGVISREEARRR